MTIHGWPISCNFVAPYKASTRPKVILSGGQTGVDQAAIRAARAAGILCAGWCPPDRRCEQGRIPDELPLTPTPSERSPNAPDIPRSQRTEWNVRDSDATLVIVPSNMPSPDPGTAWTIAAAKQMGRPLLVVDPHLPDACDQVLAWLAGLDVGILNIAGPSEQHCPGIGLATKNLLEAIFDRLGCT